jgi:hypothetical protein
MIYEAKYVKRSVTYFYCDRESWLLVETSSYHSTIASTKDFSVFNVLLLYVLVAFSRFKVDGALAINPNWFFCDDNAFVSSEYRW